MKNPIIFISILIISGATGFGLQRALTSQQTQNLPVVLPPTDASVIGTQRPSFELKDIEGDIRKMSEWDGKVLLVNFWATWCPPCKKEIPAFMELQEEYSSKGFQVIGLAIDDEESVKDYADTMGMNYPIMAAELTAMEIARLYGNRVNALPFSAFVGRDGKISLTKPGEISKEDAEEIINKLL
jgi:peroxiredoxin